MKISVQAECTPEEARTFLGLPDVQPMQRAVLDDMQKRLLASMDEFSPSTLMHDWFAPAAAAQQAWLELFKAGAGVVGRTPPPDSATSD